MEAIDTLSNTVIATIPIGQTPQAVVYVPDAVPAGPGTSNLVPLGQAGQALHVTLGPPAGTGGAARASVAVNSLGLVDLLEIGASGLAPGQEYQLALVDLADGPLRPPGAADRLQGERERGPGRAGDRAAPPGRNGQRRCRAVCRAPLSRAVAGGFR